MTANAIAEGHKEERFDRKLWITMLGAPTLWLIFLQTAYLLVQLACSTGQHFVMHAGAGFFLMLTAAMGAISWKQWRESGSGWPSEEDGSSTGRRRAMAMIGLLQSGLFALIIITGWAAMMIIDPCQNVIHP
jgi:hypothetical protein